jgi:hypothetical protein
VSDNKGRKVIDIPPEEGTVSAVFTWDNGQHTFQFIGEFDGVNYTAQTYVEMINTFLKDEKHGYFIGFPHAQHPEEPTWWSRSMLRDHLAHVHQAVVKSEGARRRMGGRQIVVPLQ